MVRGGTVTGITEGQEGDNRAIDERSVRFFGRLASNNHHVGTDEEGGVGALLIVDTAVKDDLLACKLFGLFDKKL